MAISPRLDGAAPPTVAELPFEHRWVRWRGPLSQPTAPDGNWRTLPHLQSVETCRDTMLPRIYEFHQVLKAHGMDPTKVECRVCKHAGRDLAACFEQDPSAAGGRHHLRRLWSVALSVGTGTVAEIWEEVRVQGGVVRLSHVDGTVELCRGEPATRYPEPSLLTSLLGISSLSDRSAAASSPPRRRQGTARGGSTAGHSAPAAPAASAVDPASSSSPNRRRLQRQWVRAAEGLTADGQRSLGRAAPLPAPSPLAASADMLPGRSLDSPATAVPRSRPPGVDLLPRLTSAASLPSMTATSSAQLAGSSARETVVITIAPPGVNGASLQGPFAGAARRRAGAVVQTPSQNGWKVEAGFGLEVEDEEREERVVLDGPRPLGLEIAPAEAGRRGAVVRQADGQAAAAGVEPGSTILCINDNPVEDLETSEIRGLLECETLPITLDLRPPLDLPTVRRRKAKRRDPVTVFTAGCRGSHRVVSESVAHLGWLELETTADMLNKAASVMWLEHADPTEGLAPVQTVSRLEAFLQFCKKARLAKSLNAWGDILPDAFAFSPQTWVLPYDAAEVKVAMARSRKDDTFIVKPTAGCQGKGIVLAKKWKDIEGLVNKSKASQETSKSTIEYVVQRYIGEPLLLDGLKFDMRLYVVVTSVVPLRAYLFKEGLARFCTVPYEPPTENNLREARMHLTNFAVNKKSKDFQVAEGIAQHDEGSKRSTSATLRQIEKAFGASPSDIWSKVARLTANTLMALRPQIVEYYIHEQPRPLHPLGPKGFQLIGLDVIIDQDLEPRLLEMNANPSLSAVQPARDFGSELSAEAQAPPSPSPSAPPGPPPPPPTSGGSSSSSHAPTVVPLLQPPPQAGAIGPTLSTPISTRQPRGTVATLAEVRRSRSSVALGAQQNAREDLQVAGDARRRPGSAEAPGARSGDAAGSGSGSVSGSSSAGGYGLRERKSTRHESRTRLGVSGKREGSKEESSKMVTSELDLEIKRELVIQALLLTRPAPQNKAARLKRQWKPRPANEIVPLNDQGMWALAGKPTRAEAIRADAPERCPALEAIDFEELVAPEVFEYARAHLSLYRWWTKACGAGRDSLSQAQVQRLLERNGLVGDGSGSLFPDRVSAQLWISRIWRDLAPGNFGLNLPQFVECVGRLGNMLAGTGSAPDGDGTSGRPSLLEGVLEFTRRGFCCTE